MAPRCADAMGHRVRGVLRPLYRVSGVFRPLSTEVVSLAVGHERVDARDELRELAVRGVEELLVREVHVAVAAVEEPGAVPRMK